MLTKNIRIIISITLILLIVLFMVLFKSDNSVYKITVNKIDDQSPARILKVYKDDEEISFKEIRFKDDVVLCTNINPSVFYGEVLDEDELKVMINDNEYVIAKIDKGGENEKK